MQINGRMIRFFDMCFMLLLNECYLSLIPVLTSHLKYFHGEQSWIIGQSDQQLFYQQ